jgi:hypothetical protein
MNEMHDWHDARSIEAVRGPESREAATNHFVVFC